MRKLPTFRFHQLGITVHTNRGIALELGRYPRASRCIAPRGRGGMNR